MYAWGGGGAGAGGYWTLEQQAAMSQQQQPYPAYGYEDPAPGSTPATWQQQQGAYNSHEPQHPVMQYYLPHEHAQQPYNSHPPFPANGFYGQGSPREWQGHQPPLPGQPPPPHDDQPPLPSEPPPLPNEPAPDMHVQAAHNQAWLAPPPYPGGGYHPVLHEQYSGQRPQQPPQYQHEDPNRAPSGSHKHYNGGHPAYGGAPGQGPHLQQAYGVPGPSQKLQVPYPGQTPIANGPPSYATSQGYQPKPLPPHPSQTAHTPLYSHQHPHQPMPYPSSDNQPSLSQPQHSQPQHPNTVQQQQRQQHQEQPMAGPGGPHGPGAIPAHGLSAAAVKQSLEALRPMVDLKTLLRPPGRFSRPQRLLLVLRGLPGSGKSHLARKIREIEVEEQGDAPRLHSLDEYFMTEVEKEVEEEGPRGKPRKRKVTEVEYQYEYDMAASYQRSLVKAVCKTLEEGRFPIVVMDAPNMKLSDFMEVLPSTQRHRYTTYVLQPLETDPVLCARRNIHGHNEEFVAQMAGLWEPAPSAMLLVDARPLLQGKVQGASAIQEVDMDDHGDAAEDTDTIKTSTDNANAQDASGTSNGKENTGNSTAVAAALPSAALSSRWAQQQGDEEQDADRDGGEEPSRKKVKTAASDKEILAELKVSLAGDGDGGAGSSLMAREAEMREALTAARRNLRRSKRVRWCDQPGGEDEEADRQDAINGGKSSGSAVAGFRIRAPIKPLCEIHVLEGLGPARGDTAIIYMDAESPFLNSRLAASFAEAVKAEHNTEHDLLAVAMHQVYPLSSQEDDWP